MDDFGRWLEPYPCLLMDNDDAPTESGNIGYNTCHSFTTDLADMDPAHLSHNGFLHEAAFSHFAQGAQYRPPANSLTSQRQQATQLRVNTQLPSYKINDSGSSTTSSISIGMLQTPGLLYPSFQPTINVSPPPSASTEGGMLMPDFEKHPYLPASPLSPYSPSFEGDILDVPTFLPTGETDAVTRTPMPHILEWKRVIEQCGTNDFILQRVYKPYTEADRKRYIRDVVLKETIFFQIDGSSEWGISLDDALRQRLRYLKDKDDRMFVDCGPSVSIRMEWPGYPPWSRQIPTMDFKTPKGPITRAKLAKNVATCIRRFVAAMQDEPMEPESDLRWKVGERHIGVENLILVSLHHVSKGSWQPQLRLRRPDTMLSCQWDHSSTSVPVL